VNPLHITISWFHMFLPNLQAMDNRAAHIIQELFNAGNAAWERLALEIFSFQYGHNGIYRRFCESLSIVPEEVHSIEAIPFLPIQFFKSHEVVSGTILSADLSRAAIKSNNDLTFESSGTTGSVNSKHYVKDPAVYEQSFLAGFEKFYGDPATYCIIGLLPSYLERGNSSLVYMVNELIKRSRNANSGFYLHDTEKLHQALLHNEAMAQKTLLIGVTYALLDFAAQYPMHLQHTIVMETGGMKGRRQELTREEVHHILQQQLHIDAVHSEYGMTELLSQGYSKGHGIFYPSDTMKILLRAEDDPFDVTKAISPEKKFNTGVINVIDLANVYSCSFIATDDMGKLYEDGSFEVLGRLDNSDIRGCGLMLL
jgi:hypothetical protein